MKYLIHTLSCAVLLTASSVFASDIDVRLTELCEKLAAPLATDTTQKTIAVLPFVDKTNPNQREATAIAEYLVALSQNRPGVVLVDRMTLNNTMKELALSQTGIMDESKNIAAGRTMAARYLVSGTISSMLGKALINAQLTETETGKILSTASMPIDPNLLPDFTKNIYGDNEVSGAICRSMVAPGWGQFYAHENVHGVIASVFFVGAAGGTVYSGISTAFKAKDYNDFDLDEKTNSGIAKHRSQMVSDGVDTTDASARNTWTTNKRNSLWNSYAKQQNLTIILGGVTAGVWAINVLDALWAGNQAKRNMKLYFSATENLDPMIGVTYNF